MSGAWHTGSSANGQKLAVIDRRELHEAIVRASATAFRSGVPAVRLDGLAALDASNRLVMVDRSQARRESLKARLAEERRIAKRLRLRAAGEEDGGVADEYRDDAREHTLAAKVLETELAQAESAQRELSLPERFSGEVEFLLAGIRALLDPSGAVDRDVAEALDKVLDNLQVWEASDHRIAFSFNWLIPANGTVARFGPITGSVDRLGRLMTPAERGSIEAGGIDRRTRRVLVHELGKSGLNYAIARAVSICPFPQLAEALLGGEPNWPGVDDEFDHHEFNEYLRQRYDSLIGWAKGVYCQTNPKRQALADVVAAMGGEARVDQVRVVARELGVKDTDLLPMTLPRIRATTPTWEPSVRRLGVWDCSTTVEANSMASIWCGTCNAPATAVVRVPEVPGSLLCRTCCRSPFEPERVFPSVYLNLALVPTAIPEELLERAKNLATGTIKKGRAAWNERQAAEAAFALRS
ncbi:MAG: hypothetical protein HKL85_08345 [Acidimicrobiaceae bacterium]|nr:hypothetical protein [Acidimicrobiaceae bacterium]